MKQIDKSLLLTSASSKVPLLHSTQISLHRIAPSFDVVVGDTNENSLAFHFASRVWIMPLANDKNLGVILDGCLERNIKIILPTRDGELLFFAKHKIRFKENGIDVLVSNPLSVSRCLDKLLFYHYLNDLGFPAIPTSTDIESYSGTQFVVKERFGSGSLRVKKNVSAEDCLTVASTFQSPIIQPMIFGREFSVDVWVAENGTHAIASGRFRDYVVNGEAKVTSTPLSSVATTSLSKMPVVVAAIKLVENFKVSIPPLRSSPAFLRQVFNCCCVMFGETRIITPGRSGIGI